LPIHNSGNLTEIKINSNLTVNYSTVKLENNLCSIIFSILEENSPYSLRHQVCGVVILVVGQNPGNDVFCMIWCDNPKFLLFKLVFYQILFSLISLYLNCHSVICMHRKKVVQRVNLSLQKALIIEFGITIK
jgi:hypothetical protein